eukprot:Awhi_evm1s13183
MVNKLVTASIHLAFTWALVTGQDLGLSDPACFYQEQAHHSATVLTENNIFEIGCDASGVGDTESNNYVILSLWNNYGDRLATSWIKPSNCHNDIVRFTSSCQQEHGYSQGWWRGFPTKITMQATSDDALLLAEATFCNTYLRDHCGTSVLDNLEDNLNNPYAEVRNKVVYQNSEKENCLSTDPNDTFNVDGTVVHCHEVLTFDATKSAVWPEGNQLYYAGVSYKVEGSGSEVLPLKYLQLLPEAPDPEAVPSDDEMKQTLQSNFYHVEEAKISPGSSPIASYYGLSPHKCAYLCENLSQCKAIVVLVIDDDSKHNCHLMGGNLGYKIDASYDSYVRESKIDAYDGVGGDQSGVWCSGRVMCVQFPQHPMCKNVNSMNFLPTSCNKKCAEDLCTTTPTCLAVTWSSRIRKARMHSQLQKFTDSPNSGDACYVASRYFQSLAQ